jgi:hypothetical protein
MLVTFAWYKNFVSKDTNWILNRKTGRHKLDECTEIVSKALDFDDYKLVPANLLCMASSSSIYSRVLDKRGTLFCPPSLPRWRIHSKNVPVLQLVQ